MHEAKASRWWEIEAGEDRRRRPGKSQGVDLDILFGRIQFCSAHPLKIAVKETL